MAYLVGVYNSSWTPMSPTTIIPAVSAATWEAYPKITLRCISVHMNTHTIKTAIKPPSVGMKTLKKAPKSDPTAVNNTEDE